MRNILIDYPTTLTFKTSKSFETNDERTSHLRKWLKRNKIDSPCHDYSDYVVEGVDLLIIDCLPVEYWIVGS